MFFISKDQVEYLIEVQDSQYGDHKDINTKYEWKNGNLSINVNNFEIFKKYQFLRRKKCSQCCQLKSEDSFLKYKYNDDFFNRISKRYTICFNMSSLSKKKRTRE